MNTALCENWTGFAASIPGSGHIRRGLPCQDAAVAITSPRPALIVCDGRGSAKASHDGAQGAVKAFQTQLAVFEPMLASILDDENASEEHWQQFSRIMYRTLMQVKLDLARERELPEKEFDFTVAFAVVGTCHIGCFQVGDGAIVLRQTRETITAFAPDKGDFANQTCFLRTDGEAAGKFHASLFDADTNTGIAITSDGPEHLMFKLPTMTPGKIFGMMLDDLHSASLCQQDLMDYLTRRDWENDPRGSDDRSIAILAPRNYPVLPTPTVVPGEALPDSNPDEVVQAPTPDIPRDQSSFGEPGSGPQPGSVAEESTISTVDGPAMWQDPLPEGVLQEQTQEEPRTPPEAPPSSCDPVKNMTEAFADQSEAVANSTVASDKSSGDRLKYLKEMGTPLLALCLVFAIGIFAMHEKVALDKVRQENTLLLTKNISLLAEKRRLEGEVSQREQFISLLLQPGRELLTHPIFQPPGPVLDDLQNSQELTP